MVGVCGTLRTPASAATESGFPFRPVFRPYRPDRQVPTHRRALAIASLIGPSSIARPANGALIDADEGNGRCECGGEDEERQRLRAHLVKLDDGDRDLGQEAQYERQPDRRRGKAG